jgi:Heparinase II/III-like protein
MRKCVLVLAFLSLVIPASKAAIQDYEDVCKAVTSVPKKHPYLLFDDADKATIKARLVNDQSSQEIWEKIRREGLRRINAPFEPSAPLRDPHPRFIGQDDYLSYMTEHSRAAVELAFIYQMTGDDRFAKKAYDYADRLCALDSWVQSAHRFDVIATRVWPYGAKDDEVVFTYDITTAGISRDLSLVYDWTYSALSKAERNRIRSGLLEKSITRVRGSYEYFWWNTASRCNWSGICHSGLGLAALALLDEDPHLSDVLAHSCEGVKQLLDHVDPEGGWQEGRGYWAYGFGESSIFIEAMKRASQGKINLFTHPALRDHPVDFALYGLTAGFGDGTGQVVGNSSFINKLTAESKNGIAAYYSKTFVHQAESVYDLIWPRTTVAPVVPQEGSKFFSGINWAVLRKDFTPTSLTVACKAGYNDDPHHGHLDCGTFNLTYRGKTYIGEVERTPYDEQYFGALRWEHLEAKTEAHNVLLIDNEEQLCAKLKDEPWKEGIGGTITHYHADAAWAYLEMDPTHAYSEKSLKQWHRYIALDKDHNIAVIVDAVDARPGSKIDLRFHPGVTFTLGKTNVQFQGNNSGTTPQARGRKRKSQSEVKPIHQFYTEEPDESPTETTRANFEMQTFGSAELMLTQGRQADVPMTLLDQAVWVPYYSVKATAKDTTTVIVSLFSPIDAFTPQDTHLEVKDGQYRVSFTSHGKTEILTFCDSAITAEIKP